jgi:hypothetical protein
VLIVDSSALVLHLQLKLKYFQQHGWDQTWVETAKEITRDEFAKYDPLKDATAEVVRCIAHLIVHGLMLNAVACDTGHLRGRKLL